MLQNSNDESNEDIVQRLEKLNQWQEEQTKILCDRQNIQRQILGLEHKKMYEMLGILNSPLAEKHNEVAQNVNGIASLEIGRLDQSLTDTQTSDKVPLEQSNAVIKKPFLKRGEGLKNRFKIDPNQLRLNNLPPYKYANVHRHLFEQKHVTQKKNPQNILETKPPQGAVLTNMSSSDIHEKQFKHLLISSKTACNSTPDIKVQQTLPMTPVHCETNGQTKSLSQGKTTEPISWAAVLDPKNINPIDVHEYRRSIYTETLDNSENISIFELLEQKATEGSIDFNSSCIKNLLKRQESQESNTMSLEECKFTPVGKAGLEPTLRQVTVDRSFESSDESSDEEEEPSPPNFINQPPLKPRKTNVHVRFSDENDTREFEDHDNEDDENGTTKQTSDTSEIFEQLKKILFNEQNLDDSMLKQLNTEAMSASDVPQEIVEKVDIFKNRLSDLEKEINTFKQNNQELIKAKQEHELGKAHLAQERHELMEKLKDEKIQIEIYLHDERIKIEEEKNKLEKQINLQKAGASSRDRKEIAKLNQEMENLQKELKSKDQVHIAAQARLRAQIRTLEKDHKQLSDDIDRLTKENKRLQDENLRISRENNNKMLQEINRNIAKLAPKLSSIACVDEEAATRVKEISAPLSSATTSKWSQRKNMQQSHRRSTSKTRRSPRPASFEKSSSSSSECEDDKSIQDVRNSSTESNKKKISTTPEKSLNDTNEFKREIQNSDGSKDILYPNGNIKKISADGMNVRMLYFNKDIKETNIDEGTVKYYYAQTNTWHTTYIDGLEILEFPNGQTEHRYKNGIVEVHFPNSSIKVTNPADDLKLEEWRFADGTNLIQMRNGDKILMLPNGQKEIHTALNKRREYPDGTVKLVYPDGSQETRYSNGRVRLKDKGGNLVMDTESIKY